MAESETLVQDLSAAKYLNEAQLRDTTAKLTAVESCDVETKAGLEEARIALQTSNARNFQLESEVQASRLKIGALEQKVVDKEEIMRQSGELAAAAENARRAKVGEELRVNRQPRGQRVPIGAEKLWPALPVARLHERPWLADDRCCRAV